MKLLLPNLNNANVLNGKNTNKYKYIEERYYM